MSVVVNFYQERIRLRPFATASDLWLQKWIMVANRRADYRVVLPDLLAEVRRRAARRSWK